MDRIPVDSDGPVIQIENLIKEYKSSDGTIVRAVNNVSMSVAAGEIVGLLGANGAGKTTTLRIIATLLQPTSGRAQVCGHDSIADPVGVRQSLGYVSATTGVPDRLTARELLTSFGRLHGLEEDAIKDRLDWLITTLSLRNYIDRPAGRLSSGQRQRISLGRALVHNPPALVLDEPTNALDVVVHVICSIHWIIFGRAAMQYYYRRIASMKSNIGAIVLSLSTQDTLSL